MFRPIAAASLYAFVAAIPAFADTVELPATITGVTIFPQGAQVTRRITVDAGQGQHELLIPGLPGDTTAQSVRVLPASGIRLGSVSLATGRLPVTDDTPSPAIVAAKAEVTRLEQALRHRDTAIAEILLRSAAAEDQIAFLKGLAQTSASTNLTSSGVADIRALAQMVGVETLAARQTILQAETEAATARDLRDKDIEALTTAQQALAALTTPDTDRAVLTLNVDKTGTDPVTLDIVTYVGGASWYPVYDLNLTTTETPSLTVDRGVVVSQYSGEDWTDVALTLSTARPGEQISASTLYAYPRRIISEADLTRNAAVDAVMDAAPGSGMMAPAPVAEAMRTNMGVSFQGATLTYVYDGPVSIRNGVDDLRLTLDTQPLNVETWAAAAPQYDSSAYLVGKIGNTTGEVLLPGPTMIYTDGALIGGDSLPLIAAGGDADLGFGPIDGLRLTRTIPNRSEGDVGLISRSNQQVQTTQIKVENLTERAWSIHLRDTVAYSEQDDLVVAYTSTLPVTQADPDGQRGILEWQFDLAAGATQDIRLDQTLTWPTGYVLQ